MRQVTFLDSAEQLDFIIKNCLKTQIILSPKALSRFGKSNIEDINSIARKAKENSIPVFLEWDILMTEQEFPVAVKALREIELELFDAIRVQDPGAYEYVIEELTIPIHLNLETGNHNLVGIKNWINLGQGRVERIILSIELPQKTLAEYCKQLDVEVEYLALGRILLFYTPRKLVSPAFIDHDDNKELPSFNSDFIEVLGSSEESPHKGFPIIENQHGSFMFHIKDQFLFSHLEDLAGTGVEHLRVDLRWNDNFNTIEMTSKLLEKMDSELLSQLVKDYPADTTRGYFHVNKTDVLFKKLKNQKLVRKDEKFIGHVLDAKKSSYVAILLTGQRTINVGDEILFVTPLGKEIATKVHELRNSLKQSVESASKGNLIFLNYTRGVTQKSALYFK